jgi:hypothetical protein
MRGKRPTGPSRQLRQRRGIKMLNMDQNKLMEAINQGIINKYMQNVLLVKSKTIKIYSTLPFTGAPNISDAQNFMVIKDLDKFLKTIYSFSNN